MHSEFLSNTETSSKCMLVQAALCTELGVVPAFNSSSNNSAGTHLRTKTLSLDLPNGYLLV